MLRQGIEINAAVLMDLHIILTDQCTAEVVGYHLEDGHGTGGFKGDLRPQAVLAEDVLLDLAQGRSFAHHGKGLVLQPFQRDDPVGGPRLGRGALQQGFRIFLRDGQKDLFLPEGDIFILGHLRLRQCQEPQVQLTGTDEILLGVDAGLPQLDGHIREPLPEGGIDPGKHICAALRRQADGQAVSAALDLVLQAVVGILPDEQDLPGGLQIDLTGFGGLPSAAGADEQRSMQLVFQPEDLLGKGRGRDEKPLGRFCQAFLIRDGNDVFQFFQVHKTSLRRAEMQLQSSFCKVCKV